MKKEMLEDEDVLSENELRSSLYEQHNVSKTTQNGIKYILPLLERNLGIEDRYDVDLRSKIIAEISLFESYQREPKFKIFVLTGFILLTYDFLHTFNPIIYGIVFIGLTTVYGFTSTLRSPAIMAAELEGIKDENGIPADYGAKALSSVKTNVTLVLFIVAVSIQLLVSSSLVGSEVITHNLLDGMVNPYLTAGGIGLFYYCTTRFNLVRWLKLWTRRDSRERSEGE